MLKHVMNVLQTLNNIELESKSMLKPTKIIIANSSELIKKPILKSMKRLSANTAKLIVKKLMPRRENAVNKIWNITAKLVENLVTNMPKNATHTNGTTVKQIATN